MRFAKPVALSALFGLLGLGVALLFGKPEDFLEIRNLSGRTLLISTLILALSFVCGGLRLQLLGRTLGYALRLPTRVLSSSRSQLRRSMPLFRLLRRSIAGVS